MKQTTIKWRIFKYNLIVIAVLITLVFVAFNVMIRIYFEREVFQQLNTIASHTENTALERGPRIFINPAREPGPPLPFIGEMEIPVSPLETDIFDDEAVGNSKALPPMPFYGMLRHSLNELLSILNADYILLDKEMNLISELDAPIPVDILTTMRAAIKKMAANPQAVQYNFQSGDTDYISIIKPVDQDNDYDLGWIIIYSSIEEINHLQWQINLMLLAILLFSAGIALILSSFIAKKISSPLSSLNYHIRSIAERNFNAKLYLPADDEIGELVNNINTMSDKLESYDKAQKTFLQNASHELRTPLMSILSYAEGIKYGVVEKEPAVDVIIAESNRLTRLVEDLLYLSRLDSIQENYHLETVDLREIIDTCVNRMQGLIINSHIEIRTVMPSDDIMLLADEEKLTRAVTNILSNCIRYAHSMITITAETGDDQVKISIADDGPGIDAQDFPNIFERFYKGRQGKFGLGLAISKNIIEKHGGSIVVEESEHGALFAVWLPRLNARE
jgi:signal transduction histidine kinase